MQVQFKFDIYWEKLLSVQNAILNLLKNTNNPSIINNFDNVGSIKANQNSVKNLKNQENRHEDVLLFRSSLNVANKSSTSTLSLTAAPNAPKAPNVLPPNKAKAPNVLPNKPNPNFTTNSSNFSEE